MINNDPNRSNPSNASNENRDENRSMNDSNSASEPLGESIPDLDGDGFIGNTGGFYGGTSYIGSNYSENWNSSQSRDDQNEGNYGAAGQADFTDDPKSDDEANESRD